MNKYRVVVVENRENVREGYVEVLRQAGFQVDAAGSLRKALDLVERKTYHVALVDLMLRDPTDLSLEGLQVLSRLRDLAEGTECIALSAQDQPKTAVDTLKKYGATDYIDKSELLTLGMGHLVDEVTRAASAVKLNTYGGSHSVLPVLAGEAGSIVWVHQCSRVLGRGQALRPIEQFFDRLCRPLVPLMPQRGVSTPMVVDEEQRIVRGSFWSKGLGLPVELVAFRGERLFQVGIRGKENVLGDLEEGAVPEEVRRRFHVLGAPLSEDATIVEELSGAQWRIVGGHVAHVLVKRGRNVHAHQAVNLLDTLGWLASGWGSRQLAAKPYSHDELFGYAFRLPDRDRSIFVEKLVEWVRRATLLTPERASG